MGLVLFMLNELLIPVIKSPPDPPGLVFSCCCLLLLFVLLMAAGDDLLIPESKDDGDPPVEHPAGTNGLFPDDEGDADDEDLVDDDEQFDALVTCDFPTVRIINFGILVPLFFNQNGRS